MSLSPLASFQLTFPRIKYSDTFDTCNGKGKLQAITGYEGPEAEF